MKSSDILLTLDGGRLEVFKNSRGICVCYQNAEIKEGNILISEYGEGEGFETACDDFLNKIRGKTLVFKAYSESRKEIIVLG